MTGTTTLTFGQLVRAARVAADKTQPEVVEAFGGGLAVTFFSDVERDKRPLNRRHWPWLVRGLPALTIEALAEAHVRTWPAEINATRLSAEARKKLAEVLVEAVREEDFP